MGFGNYGYLPQQPNYLPPNSWGMPTQAPGMVDPYAMGAGFDPFALGGNYGLPSFGLPTDLTVPYAPGAPDAAPKSGLDLTSILPILLLVLLMTKGKESDDVDNDNDDDDCDDPTTPADTRSDKQVLLDLLKKVDDASASSDDNDYIQFVNLESFKGTDACKNLTSREKALFDKISIRANFDQLERVCNGDNDGTLGTGDINKFYDAYSAFDTETEKSTAIALLQRVPGNANGVVTKQQLETFSRTGLTTEESRLLDVMLNNFVSLESQWDGQRDQHLGTGDITALFNLHQTLKTA